MHVGHGLHVHDVIGCVEKNACYILHCCKDPCHKKAVGYKNKLPKDHPHYLYYRKDDLNLYLNLVDADDPRYFSDDIIRVAMDFINEAIAGDGGIVIHCNKGKSRSAGIALIWLLRNGKIKADTFEELEEKFRTIYPMYAPQNGMRMKIRQYFEELCND